MRTGNQVLLYNGDFLNAKIAAPTGRVEKLLKAKKGLPQVIEELYLVALSRPPSPDEVKAATEHLAKNTDKRKAWEDLVWALLNSKEFLFRH